MHIVFSIPSTTSDSMCSQTLALFWMTDLTDQLTYTHDSLQQVLDLLKPLPFVSSAIRINFFKVWNTNKVDENKNNAIRINAFQLYLVQSDNKNDADTILIQKFRLATFSVPYGTNG